MRRGLRETESAGRPDGLAITWLGRATVLIELDGARVLTDPVLRSHVGPLVRVAPTSAVRDPVDCALLSDLHRDHADLPTLRGLARRGPLIVPPHARDWLVGKGIPDVQELAPSRAVTVGGLAVTATRGRHAPRRGPFGPIAQPLGYVLSTSLSIYFSADTAALPEMADLRGQVDVALLPIAEGRPRMGHRRMGHRHLDPEGAAAAVALINPSVVIPIQWGTFSLGGVAGRRGGHLAVQEFAAHARRYAPRAQICILDPTERIVL
ncbi:MAG TPA: MBL fold metallo-hydrolase [Solirubrobacteraceae bacterium]|jgi:L-ascorbate metabolism protein UlaG (beta-lactamase superfamily)|nr:MBL fold metallo-hydrolase [Solirubrobacteraceae bacterium]